MIGIYPAGLGRSYTELVRLQPAFAQRVVQLVGELHRSGAAVSPATTPMEAALSLQHWTATPESLRQILDTAPERTTALLARFGNWAMGAVPQAQRRASVLHEAADVGPVDWLLARGLLVPLDAAHVELPHSVGVSLRGGFVIEKFALTPPVPRLGSTSAALRRNAALGAIAETLRLVGELLYIVREQPLVTLRSGGVGVRELKRLADGLRLEMHDAGVLAELCALAGLIRLDVDSSAWVQPAQLEWLTLPRQEQWLWLVNAWLASERAPSLVGQPVNGQAAVPALHRGAAGSTINALSAEAQRPDAPVVRKRILEILAELTEEAAARGRAGPGPGRRGGAGARRLDPAPDGTAFQLADPRCPGRGRDARPDRLGRAQPDRGGDRRRTARRGDGNPGRTPAGSPEPRAAPGGPHGGGARLPRAGADRKAPHHGRRRRPGTSHDLPVLRLLGPARARRGPGCRRRCWISWACTRPRRSRSR